MLLELSNAQQRKKPMVLILCLFFKLHVAATPFFLPTIKSASSITSQNIFPGQFVSGNKWDWELIDLLVQYCFMLWIATIFWHNIRCSLVWWAAFRHSDMKSMRCPNKIYWQAFVRLTWCSVKIMKKVETVTQLTKCYSKVYLILVPQVKSSLVTVAQKWATIGTKLTAIESQCVASYFSHSNLQKITR